MHVCDSKEELEAHLKGTIEEEKVINLNLLRQKFIDMLVYNAVFGTQEVKSYAKKLISTVANKLNIKPASILPLYNGRIRGEWGNMTVPAINIRGLTYEVARTIFRVMKKNAVGLVIFEIARSEIGYTAQPPDEYATVILAAAIKEDYSGPIFLQGDHFQLRRAKFFSTEEEREKEIETVKNLINSAIDAGFYQIDIDTSTLVNLELPTIDEQQKTNYLICAKLADFIEDKVCASGKKIAIGGEIGEIGSKNSTEEELHAFLKGYFNNREEKYVHLVKVAVQTGTTHGGIPLPDGSIANVKLDFETLAKLGEVATEYNLAGVVQHGASTLPIELFDKFPEVGTAEIHLATEFQNIIYKYMPEELKKDIYNFLVEKCKDERKEGDTDEQFFYKTRKKAFGEYKYQIWNLPKENISKITEELENKFSLIFHHLGVEDTVELLSSYY